MAAMPRAPAGGDGDSGRFAYCIGLMSGTSLDGVDGALVQFSGRRIAVAGFTSAPLSAALRAELLALNTAGHNELHRAAVAGLALADVYADVVDQLLAASGLAASDVAAIGAHGQTVRHQPNAAGDAAYTLQLNQPARLAERTGIDVVADFRSADIAAGGQGAPLVPAFHREVFGRAGTTVLVLNLGGIANLTVLGADGGVLGFDCGPANVLMDHWCERHTGRPYDAAGAWAATGHLQPALLATLLSDPYFALPPPKSTGRDHFHPDWLMDRLAACGPLQPADVQATLCELTASSCVRAIQTWGGSAQTLLLCGGGALNTQLVQRLQLALPGISVESTGDHGLAPQQVESAAFAWLARQHLQRAPASMPAVTGARGARILGACYPAT